MNSTEFNNFVLKKNSYFLPNDTITKIHAYKIKHQPKAEMFVQDCDNLIKNKLK
jgi:hypothetical protein